MTDARLDQAKQALEKAHARYLDAIDTTRDARAGFRHASELSTWHRKQRSVVSKLRSRLVATVRNLAKTSFADTGQTLGVSTARVQQLYQQARDIGDAPPTHHRYRGPKPEPTVGFRWPEEQD